MRISSIFLFVAGMLLNAITGAGQTLFYNGLLPDDDAYDQTPVKQVERAEIPTRFSLRSYCPTPGDQGNLPSCAGWALANALTIQKAIQRQETSRAKIDGVAHSVPYIYNQIKKDTSCEAGACFSDGLKLLRDKGDCLADIFNYPKVNCKTAPQKAHHQQAARYCISSYQRLFKREDIADIKIDVICTMLFEKKPVLIGIKVPASLRTTIPQKPADWKPEDLHGMIVIGYNTDTDTFELMNSYGSAWGDGGFCTIDFDSLAKNIQYGYVMELPQQFGKVK